MNGYSTRKHPPHGQPQPSISMGSNGPAPIGANSGTTSPAPPPKRTRVIVGDYGRTLTEAGIDPISVYHRRLYTIYTFDADDLPAERTTRRTYTLAPAVPYWLRYLAIGLLFVTVAKLLTLCAPL